MYLTSVKESQKRGCTKGQCYRSVPVPGPVPVPVPGPVPVVPVPVPVPGTLTHVMWGVHDFE